MQGFKNFGKYFVLPIKIEIEANQSWFKFLITVRKDAGLSHNKIVKYLGDNKVAIRMFFAGNITRRPNFRGKKYRIYGELFNTNRIMNDTFWIGVFQRIGKE